MFRLHEIFCQRFFCSSSSGTTTAHNFSAWNKQYRAQNGAQISSNQTCFHISMVFLLRSSNAIDSLMRKYLKLFSQFHYTSIVQCTWHPESRIRDRKREKGRKRKKNKIEKKKKKKKNSKPSLFTINSRNALGMSVQTQK